MTTDSTQCDANSTGYCETHGREYHKCQSNTQAELRGQLTKLLTSMNRYFHTELDERLVEFITAYTNKQVEAVLDRLEK